MAPGLHFSNLGRWWLVLLLILWTILPQSRLFDLSITGIEIPLRISNGSIDVLVFLILFLVVVLIQKARGKGLKDLMGDTTVYTLLVGGLVWAGLQILF